MVHFERTVKYKAHFDAKTWDRIMAARGREYLDSSVEPQPHTPPWWEDDAPAFRAYLTAEEWASVFTVLLDGSDEDKQIVSEVLRQQPTLFAAITGANERDKEIAARDDMAAFLAVGKPADETQPGEVASPCDEKTEFTADAYMGTRIGYPPTEVSTNASESPPQVASDMSDAKKEALCDDTDAMDVRRLDMRADAMTPEGDTDAPEQDGV